MDILNRPQGTDRYLFGIAAGVVLLLVVAVAVVLLRPEPTYQADDSPEDVAHNYLLALIKADYERAYGYLSPTLDGYPESVAKFTQDIEWSASLAADQEPALAVESSQ